MTAPMQDYIRLLCEKLDTASRIIQRETMDFDLEIVAYNHNLSHPTMNAKLQEIGKSLDQIAFLRTELLLVKERVMRRTLTKAQIREIERKERNGEAPGEFMHYMGEIMQRTLPKLDQEWIDILKEGANLVDTPALDILASQSAGKAVVELLSLKAKEQEEN